MVLAGAPVSNRQFAACRAAARGGSPRQAKPPGADLRIVGIKNVIGAEP
jgi:hypothetical protein